MPSDQAGIERCVEAAYGHYIDRIGKPPGPMLDDYRAVIASHMVFVAMSESEIAGLLVLIRQPGFLLLDNIAVHPDSQGLGIGAKLMNLAEEEALRQGCNTIALYTHETMVENVAIYRHAGYRESERKTVDGYQRIYMKKNLVNP